MNRHLYGLYVITDNRHTGLRLEQQVEQALQGGARIVQYRDKQSPETTRQTDAKALRSLCDRFSARLIINDDVKLALECRADGVHLGKDDTALAEARRIMGQQAIIGISCYNRIERAIRAAESGADYIAFGRFHPSVSKPGAVQADISLLHEARLQLDLPIVAIGGITPENGQALISAGADMLAVINAVFGAADIGAASRQFAKLFNNNEDRP